MKKESVASRTNRELRVALTEHRPELSWAALYSIVAVASRHRAAGGRLNGVRLPSRKKRVRSKSLYPGMVLHAAWNAYVLCGELHYI
jgi:hypothetical protein